MAFSPVTVSDTVVRVDLNVSEVLGDALVPEYVVYADLNQTSPGNAPVVYNMECVMQGLTNLFNTRPGERLFRPPIGSAMHTIVFKPINDTTSLLLKQILINSVEKWEPRVQVIRNRTRITPQPDLYGYDISVWYQALGLSAEALQYKSFYYVGN